jgi:transcriptional regulator of acetoin/glycerol metabolism
MEKMGKIAIEKNQRTIHVHEKAARILKKAGWREVDESPVILKTKLTSDILKSKLSEAPQEVKQLIVQKKEVADAVKADDSFTPDGKPAEKTPVVKKPAAKKRVRKSKPKAK